MKLLVLQHLACEHPATFRSFLEEDGIGWDAIELDEGDAIPPLESYDMLWVMGGPMNVWDVEEHPWLIPEKRAIRRSVRELKRPFLGVCFGHQLLADALGGTCGPQRPPEVGILDVGLTEAGQSDPVFAGLPHEMKALQWHGVKVAQAPDDAVVLARSDVCAIQAMRIGRHAYSMQYHVEIEPNTIPDWGKVPAYEAALAKVRGPGALQSLAKEAEPLMPGFIANARKLYRNFMAVTAPSLAK
jgi:GMP synthase-like glutamine amidotransferase